eukprot:4581404-Alexandrium_andersonii.AAC.1
MLQNALAASDTDRFWSLWTNALHVAFRDASGCQQPSQPSQASMKVHGFPDLREGVDPFAVSVKVVRIAPGEVELLSAASGRLLKQANRVRYVLDMLKAKPDVRVPWPSSVEAAWGAAVAKDEEGVLQQVVGMRASGAAAHKLKVALMVAHAQLAKLSTRATSALISARRKAAKAKYLAKE